jgi:hypothetical protein
MFAARHRGLAAARMDGCPDAWVRADSQALPVLRKAVLCAGGEGRKPWAGRRHYAPTRGLKSSLRRPGLSDLAQRAPRAYPAANDSSRIFEAVRNRLEWPFYALDSTLDSLISDGILPTGCDRTSPKISPPTVRLYMRLGRANLTKRPTGSSAPPKLQRFVATKKTARGNAVSKSSQFQDSMRGASEWRQVDENNEENSCDGRWGFHGLEPPPAARPFV